MRLDGITAAVAALSMLISPVLAQTRATISIVVEDLDDDARKCGVDIQTVRSPAILTLRNNRIAVRDGNTYPYLYINANLLPINNGSSCIFNLEVSIRDVEAAIFRNGFKRNGGEAIVLCSKAYLGISPRYNVSKHLSDRIEENLKRCLADVDY